MNVSSVPSPVGESGSRRPPALECACDAADAESSSAAKEVSPEVGVVVFLPALPYAGSSSASSTLRSWISTPPFIRASVYCRNT